MADYSYTSSGGAVVGYDGILRDDNEAPVIDHAGGYIETDTYLNRTVVFGQETAGCICSGIADASVYTTARSVNFAASGGSVSGAEVVWFRHVNHNYQGGCVAASGPLENVKTTSFEASGGGDCGGAAQGGVSQVSAGGALCSGSATVLRGEVSPGSGGAVIAGDAGNVKNSLFLATRGGVVGGSVSGGKSQFVSAQNGAVCGGSASFNLSNIKQHSAQGGAVFGSGTLITDNNGEPLLDDSGNPVEAETLFVVRRTTVVSGGAVVAGSYTTANSIAFQASGGAVCEGYSAFRFNDLENDQFVYRGGCVTGAQATFSCFRAQEFSGGAVAASQANVTVRDINPCSEGAVVGAETIQLFSRSVSASGGSVAGGDGSRARGVSFEASGGAVAEGTRTVSRRVSLAAQGGPECSGEAVYSFSRSATVSGGAITQGQSDFSIVGALEGSGGGVVSGTAQASSSGGQNQIQVGDGGAVCRGDADKLARASSLVSRGAVAGGDTIRGKGYLYNASGGSVVNGTAVYSSLVNHDYSTGAVGGGNAGVLINGGQDVVHVASGGPVINGSALINVKVNSVSSRGAICRGIADYLFAIAIADDYSSGTICGGDSPNESTKANYLPAYEFFREEQVTTFYRTEQVLWFYPPVRIIEFELEAAA